MSVNTTKAVLCRNWGGQAGAYHALRAPPLRAKRLGSDIVDVFDAIWHSMSADAIEQMDHIAGRMAHANAAAAPSDALPPRS